MSASDFDRIGELLRDHVDAPASESAHAMLRARVVGEATPSRPRRLPVLAAAALAVSMATLIAVIALRHPSEHKPISFRVEGAPAALVAGTWLAPAGTQPLSVTFSEGSVIVLDPQARARIAATTPEGASFELESGRAHFQIVHRADTEWRVVAGPYQVRVHGTSFYASWDAASEVFELSLESGSVVVHGPGIEAGIQLDGVQHFVGRPSSSASPAPCATAPPATSTEPVLSADAPGSSHSAANEASPVRLPTSAPAVSSAPPQESWSALAAKGQYRSIVDQAQARGAAAAIASASQPDLWALAEAARLVGNGSLARQALLAMRSRFPDSARAVSAAFLLGRMSDDGGGAGEAIAWYDRYVAEAPGGAFVPEALGRRMVALRKIGNTAEARQAASDYLQRFPHGPYAGVARDLVGP